MFKKSMACAVVLSLAGLVGCGGGSHTTHGGATVKLFTLSLPSEKQVDQGKDVPEAISIKREKDFADAVTLTLSDDKKGLDFPATAEIKGPDSSADVTFKTTDKTEEGEHTITVTAKSTKAEDKGTFKIKVAKPPKP